MAIALGSHRRGPALCTMHLILGHRLIDGPPLLDQSHDVGKPLVY